MRSEKFWTWFNEFAAPKLCAWPKMARANTFRQMFEHMDSFDRPVHIVETGCIEDPDNWAGNGCSTILFEKYVETHPDSSARSLELAPEKVELGKQHCPNVEFHCGDSVEHLKLIAAVGVQIDLLYLDASNHNWMLEVPSQVHHYNELLAAMPALHANSLVVIDDSMVCLDDYPQNKIIGKGGLVAQYAFEVGAELKFCEYQTGFTHITGSSPTTIEHIDDLILRARQLVEAGQMIAADRIYRLVIHVTAPPWTGRARIARGEACANFARNAHTMNKYGIAADWWHLALEADPLATDYRCDLARSLVALGALGPARRQASIATDIEPENPATWQTLGGVESDMMNEQACLEAYDRQVETSQGDIVQHSDALLNRATIALDTRDYPLVRELCARIIDLGVYAGDGYHILAMLEYRLSSHELAIELFDKALELKCRNEPLTRWNKSLPMQSIGLLKEGCAEHAWGEKEMTVQALYIPQHRFNKPKWRGQPAPATIHIHAEAGAGDNISMFRYFPLLLERGYKVHYEADPSMLSLVAHNFPDVVCMPRTRDYPGVVGIKDFDYHLPIGDLMHAFGTDIDTIPWNGPYLKADSFLAGKMKVALREHYAATYGGRRIGLCWSSGIRKTINIWMEKYGRMKSMRFADVKPLLEEDLHVYSLQVGDGRDEQTGFITDLLPAKPTWDETAALIDNLDLVITVDTGVAHLAGAMGKPCWVMMQRDGASWHFMCYRPGASWNESSPWYPSIRLFRQHEFNQPGYWKDVVDDVVSALGESVRQAAE